MNGTPDGAAARRALQQAEQARALGARRATRPGWYHLVLGVGMFLALASFSLDRPAAGVAVGLVLVPVAAELLARQQTGAQPLQRYDDRSVRGVVVGYVVLVLVLAAAGITAERAADLPGAAAVSGALVLVATVLAGRRLDERRASGAMSPDPA